MYRRYLRAIMHEIERVQRQIEREQCSPNPDWRRILKLKKVRLALKDRVHSAIAEARGPAAAQSRQTYAAPLKTLSPNS